MANLTSLKVLVCAAANVCLLLNLPCHAASADGFSDPEPVQIVGYSGDAMEPFISRDGKYLFFNNRNDPGVDTNLHWADNVDGKTFRYRGEIQGVNTRSLEGVPSMDRAGTFYFISPRSYDRTLSTIYHGQFNNGRVENVELLEGLSRQQRCGCARSSPVQLILVG
jgi:hypothetical protein